MPAATPAPRSVEPQAPLGHLSRLGFALVGAAGVDEIARSLMTDLAALPGVRRVGFAMSEGGGRRLRFTASDRSGDGPVSDPSVQAVDWCHIDAYDDVPLTSVVRTGEPMHGRCDRLDPRFAEFVAGQPDEVSGLAAVPLPGIGSPIGGLILFVDDEWTFDDARRRLLEATARRAAEAVRRLRAGGSETVPEDPEPEDGSALTARIVVDGDPRSASVARRFLRELLARGEVRADVVDIAQLCLSELVTNAIVHTGSRIELRATVAGDHLTVSVRDRGGEAPDATPDADPDPLRVHGRGLLLVEALSDRWGSERDAVGTSVWFSLDLDGAPEEVSGTG